MLEIVGGLTLGNLPGKSDAFDLRNRKSSTTITATTNGLPIGGSTGNVLVKNSGTNYDAVWNTLATAGIAAASHTHGNITNAGLLTTAVTLGSTPKFVITDTSTNAIGTYTPTGTASATTYLSGTGVWSTPVDFTGSGTSITGLQSAAGVALPISTANNTTASGAITFQTGSSSTISTTTGTLTIATGSHSNTSTGTSGAISIKSGDTTGAGGNSGAVTIDVGTGSGTGAPGTLNIGNTNARTINLGSNATGNKTLTIQPNGTTGTNTINIGTGTVSTGGIAINLGTASISSGSTTITIGASGSTTSLAGTTSTTGSLNLVAGTTALNPIKFTANSSTPTLAAGVVDFDGNAFFATPKVNNTTAGKGLIPTQQIFIPNANTTIATTSTASATINGTAMGNRSIYLAASTTYEIDAVIYVQSSFTGTAATNFQMGMSVSLGSTTLVNAVYSYTSSTTVSATPTQVGLGAGNITISASPTSGNWIRVVLKGIVKTGSAGNCSPYFLITNGSGVSTATMTVGANSFIKVNPIAGTGADINIGGWA
jgi:hypothetical protein